MNVTSADNYAFAAANIFEPPFQKETFDVVVISAALHHFADTVIALRHMSNLLCPGGTVVLLREPGKVVPDDATYIRELADGFNEQQFELAEYDVMFERTHLVPLYELDFECSYKAIVQKQ